MTRLPLCLVAVVVLLTACAPTAQEQADDDLVARYRAVHETALDVRAADPAAAGDAASTAFLQGYGGTTAPARDGEALRVDVVLEALAATGGGLSYEQSVRTLCVRVTATAGDPEGAVGERGRVTTTPVPCATATADEVPHGTVEPLVDDVPVPDPPRPVCVSGSGDCPGGG